MDIGNDMIVPNIVKMKFIRKEHIITTIFNKELTDSYEILTVFKNLLNHGIEFSIIMKKFMYHQQDYFNMSVEKVRIRKINEDNTLDLLTFKKGIKTSMTKVPFDDIVEINATTMKNKILDVDSSITRFELLDL